MFYTPVSGERCYETCTVLFLSPFLSSASDLQAASFLAEFSVTYVYSQLALVYQASVELLGGTFKGWEEIYSKRIMLFMNVHQSTYEHHPSQQ